MAEIRGRPIAWIGVVLALWVGARVSFSGQDIVQPAPKAYANKPTIRHVAPPSLARWATSPSAAPRTSRPRQPKAHQSHRNFGLTPALDPWQDGGRPSGLSSSALVAGGDEPLSAGRDTPPSNALAPVGKAGQPEGRWGWGGSIYAYSFWRFATGSSTALAPGAQYGGSQSGLIATVDPFGDPDKGLAFLARGAMTPDGDGREVALGLRWQPDADWPFLLSAERRFRANEPDRFAAYLSGGVDDLRLTGKWQFDAYGQAGYATGRSGGGFFEAQARLTRPVAKVMGVPLSIGAGGWAGGQRGSKRLDVGPTAVARVDTGPAVVIIQLDWRLRAAGNAAPKDGVALTVSTSL